MNQVNHARNLVLCVGAIAITGGATLIHGAFAQQSIQPSTKPSLPGPKSPSPSPQRDPARSPTKLDQQQPGNHLGNQPVNPNDPNQVANNRNSARGSFVRPFAFQSPQAETAFNQSSRRLMQMEQRMEKSRTDLLRRLGEARAMTGERQSAALMDIIQQSLMQSAELNNYLKQSRTMWTGDMDESMNGDQQQLQQDQQAQPGQDGQQQQQQQDPNNNNNNNNNNQPTNPR